MTNAKTEVIAAVDSHLQNAGMVTYSELVALLNEARRLGLNFDRGNAYIYRAYIDKQDALNSRIDAVNKAFSEK